jgi:hypothetical protein
MPIVLATRETEIRRIIAKASLRKMFSKPHLNQ